VDLIDLSDLPGRHVEAHGSAGFTAARVLHGATAATTFLRIAAGGTIGAHPAPVDQLLVVLTGSGEVRSGDGPWRSIVAGQAAVWRAGEEHATRTATGLTALGVESADLA
jgi:quercetin dioxygenase-like cupin family protein